MEENSLNDSPKYVIKTASLILYGLYAVLIALYVNGVYPTVAMMALVIISVFFATGKLVAGINLWRNKEFVAYGYLTHEPTSQNLPALNPYLSVNIANTIISVAVAIFISTQGDGSIGAFIASTIILAPCIFIPILYNRLSDLTRNETIVTLAKEEMAVREIEYKRNIILNEEMSLAMPGILDKVHERWREAGLLTEETNERDESGESDQGNLSATNERD